MAAPATDSLVSDAELLALADGEMRTELAQVLIGAKSEYWLADATQAVTSGTATYRLPSRSLGMTLRKPTLYDASGNEWPLGSVSAEDRYAFTSGSVTGIPHAFTLEDGSITLLPTPGVSGLTLRFRYYASPSTLDLTSNCALITRATATTTIQTSSTPSAMAVADTDRYVDVIRGAGMFDRMYEDLAMTVFAANEATLSASTPIVVADITTALNHAGGQAEYLVRAGYTPLPPIPDVLWPVLVAATRRSYCEAVGDVRGMAAAENMFSRKRAAAVSLLTPRVDGQPPRVIPSATPLRGGGRRVGRWVS